MGSPDSPLQEHVLRGLLPSHNEEDRLRPHLWMPVFPKLPTLTHALLSPSGRCALEQGCHDQVDSWDVGKIGASGQGGMRVEEPGSCSWRSLT